MLALSRFSFILYTDMAVYTCFAFGVCVFIFAVTVNEIAEIY